jgi:dGTPase
MSSRDVGFHDDRESRSDQRERGRRDRDRILYSSAFRRLAEVTQVISPFDGHVFHNRLTHTLEVAQIARSIAELLMARTDKGKLEEAGLDPDVVEAAALAHDIGHPPFGHCGETVLDELVKGDSKSPGPEDGFEGNAQSFRIVTKLATRHPDFPGLNLSRATLAAIQKYPWHRADAPSLRQTKFSAYLSEKEVFDDSRTWIERKDLIETRTLEAEIMDWADDVAYSIHDLDDFYRAGLIPLNELISDTGKRHEFVERALEHKEAIGKPSTFSEEELKDAVDDLLGGWEGGGSVGLAPPSLAEPYSGSKSQRGALKTFTSMLISRYVLGPKTQRTCRVQVPSKPGGRWLQVLTEYRREVTILKELTSHYVFGNPRVLIQQHGAAVVIRSLFEWLVNVASERRRPDFGIIPPFYRELIEQQEPCSDEVIRRTTADLISAMTEGQVLSLFERLGGHRVDETLFGRALS